MKNVKILLILLIMILTTALIFMWFAFSNMKESAELMHIQYEAQKELNVKLEKELEELKVEYNILD